eukprot:Em0001g3140a
MDDDMKTLSHKETYIIAVKTLGFVRRQKRVCSTLDPLGHHAATCKRGGEAVLRHNKLTGILVTSFHLAHIHVEVEAGSGLSHDHSHSRPADWDDGKPAALDLSVISMITANILNEASMTVGAAAQAAEARKHTCTRSAPYWDDLVYLAVESYGTWPRKSKSVSHFLHARLAVHMSSSKSKTTFDLYSRLNLALTRLIASAFVSRSFSLADFVV